MLPSAYRNEGAPFPWIARRSTMPIRHIIGGICLTKNGHRLHPQCRRLDVRDAGSCSKRPVGAAYSTGMAWSQVMRRTILPQADRIAVPPRSNTFIALVNDPSLAAGITVPGLFRAEQQIVATSLRRHALIDVTILDFRTTTRQPRPQALFPTADGSPCRHYASLGIDLHQRPACEEACDHKPSLSAAVRRNCDLGRRQHPRQCHGGATQPGIGACLDHVDRNR